MLPTSRAGLSATPARRTSTSTAWIREALSDPFLVEVTPYPRSRLNASAFIGWSNGAQHALVVIGYCDLAGDLHGMNAWPASGRDLATYQEGVTHEQEG